MMTWMLAGLGGLLGTVLAAVGGFVLARRGEPRSTPTAELESSLRRVLARLESESDNVAAAVDPLVSQGREALDAILTRVLEVGGYEAVVLSDEAGLIVSGVGASEWTEILAVTAAAFGAIGGRVGVRHEAVVEGHPERRWTVHRYFSVDGARLSVSATRHGATPRLDALDGAVGALARVLGADSLRQAS